MTRMLGRYRVPGLCAPSRSNRPCGDCDGASSLTARYAKRVEARQLAKDINAELRPQPDLEHLATLGPGWDFSDCEHGCNGESPCGSERCWFGCHPREDATASQTAASPR